MYTAQLVDPVNPRGRRWGRPGPARRGRTPADRYGRPLRPRTSARASPAASADDALPGAGSGGGLHFDGDDIGGGELGEKIDFTAALLLPEVEKAWPVRAVLELGTDLGDDEGVEDAAEEISLAHEGGHVQTEDGTDQCRIDEVAFRSPYQPGETVAGPRREQVEHEQIG
jgi:hypothetical protein